MEQTQFLKFCAHFVYETMNKIEKPSNPDSKDFTFLPLVLLNLPKYKAKWGPWWHSG
jgi:hypothetical protein